MCVCSATGTVAVVTKSHLHAAQLRPAGQRLLTSGPNFCLSLLAPYPYQAVLISLRTVSKYTAQSTDINKSCTTPGLVSFLSSGPDHHQRLSFSSPEAENTLQTAAASPAFCSGDMPPGAVEIIWPPWYSTYLSTSLSRLAWYPSLPRRCHFG